MVQSAIVSVLAACVLINLSTAAPVDTNSKIAVEKHADVDRRAVLNGHGHYFSLRNRYHPECLNADLNIRRGVHVGECNIRDTLYVRYREEDETIRTHHGWCLGMGTELGSDGEMYSNMEVQECNGSDNQKWMAPNYDGQRHLESKSNHMLEGKSQHLCADVMHQHWNADVIMWKCKDINSYKFLNQQWVSFGRLGKHGKADFVVQEVSESTLNGTSKRVA